MTNLLAVVFQRVGISYCNMLFSVDLKLVLFELKLIPIFLVSDSD